MKKEMVEIIARFLEHNVREDDAERERFPSLKRMPKDDDTWIGWVAAAKKLYGALFDRAKTVEARKCPACGHQPTSPCLLRPPADG